MGGFGSGGQNRRSVVLHHCEGCGAPYLRRRSHVGRFCSRSCASSAPRNHKRGRTLYTFICEQCGGSFRKVRRRGVGTRFCSKTCVDQSQVKWLICVICSVRFAPRQSSNKAGCCSRKCGDAYRSRMAAIARNAKRLTATPRVIPDRRRFKCLECGRRIRHTGRCEVCQDVYRSVLYLGMLAERKQSRRTTPRAPRVCPGCGVTFQPFNDGILYCSRRCGRAINKRSSYPRLGAIPRGSERDRLAGFIATVRSFRQAFNASNQQCPINRESEHGHANETPE